MSATTLSARFDEKELEVLKRAADLRQWSFAQLIRAGAYEKAVNIVNAATERSYPVRRLIARIIEQLIQPKLIAIFNDRGDEELSLDERSRLVELWNHAQGYDFGSGWDDLGCTTLHRDHVEKLAVAIRALGSELGTIVVDELQRAVHSETKMEDLILPEPGSTEQLNPDDSVNSKKSSAKHQQEEAESASGNSTESQSSTRPSKGKRSKRPRMGADAAAGD